MQYRLTLSMFKALTVTVTASALVSLAACHDDPTSIHGSDPLPSFQMVVVTDLTAIDLSALPASTLTFANSINEAGQIVGSSHLDDGGDLAFLWDNGLASDLGGLGGTRTWARTINENGQVGGDGRISGSSENHAILWNGAPQDLMTLGGDYSIAHGVNDAAPVQVVGQSQTKGDATHAFLWTDDGTGMRDIHDEVCSGGCECSIAFDINDAGQIVGTNKEAFVWSEADGLVILPGLEAKAYSVAFGINEAGQIVGVSGIGYDQHAVLWEEGQSGYAVSDLGTGLNDHSVAYDINEAGQIVGRGSNLNSVRACLDPVLSLEALPRPLLWHEGAVIDLGTLPPKEDKGGALALNNAGEIVGWNGHGTSNAAVRRAVRWRIEVRPATPEEVTEELIGEVESLVAIGDIGEGNGTALLKKLDAITRKLNDGKIIPAINLLEAFVHQVEAYVSAGILTEEQGDALIQAAQNAIELLNR